MIDGLKESTTKQHTDFRLGGPSEPVTSMEQLKIAA
jgi:hypothetical protein